MLRFKKISLERMRKLQWFQFMYQYRTLVRESGAETLKILELWEMFSPLYTKADELINQNKGNEKTKTIEDYDTERDELFVGLNYILRGNTRHFNADKKAAAKKILQILKNYGKNIPRLARDEETAALYNIIGDIRTKCTAEMNLLAVSDWITELDKANKGLENVLLERNIEEGAKAESEKLSAVMNEMDALYRDMTAKIEAAYIMEKTEIFKDFITTWNENIERYKKVLAERYDHENEEETEK